MAHPTYRPGCTNSSCFGGHDLRRMDRTPRGGQILGGCRMGWQLEQKVSAASLSKPQNMYAPLAPTLAPVNFFFCNSLLFSHGIHLQWKSHRSLKYGFESGTNHSPSQQSAFESDFWQKCKTIRKKKRKKVRWWGGGGMKRNSHVMILSASLSWADAR